MTKEIPPTIDQITIEQLRWLEAALAFKRNMKRRNEENDPHAKPDHETLINPRATF